MKTGWRLLAASGLAAALAGCVSTQQKAAWLHVQDARTLIAQGSTLVRTGSRQVRVQEVSIIRHGQSTAFAVRLRNLTGRLLSDLPISVGVVSRGKRVYLNRSSNLAYFQTHVPLVRAHATATWVLAETIRALPAGRAFALVGSRSAPALRLGSRPPHIEARLVSDDRGRLALRLVNPSSVPQPQLQVYAVTPSGARITAAGSSTLGDLGAGQAETARLNLVGHPTGSPQLEVLPTLFLP